MANNISFDLTAPGAKKAIIKFVIRLAILFTIWHLIYGQFLVKSGVIERPLTNIITFSVVQTINFLSPSTKQIAWAENLPKKNDYLILNDQKVFVIGYACAGLNLMFTYVSVILLLPYPLKRKLVFSIGGILIIILANIIRITALYYIYVYQKNAFDFNHHYLFTILMDILIFYGWLLFIKKKKV